MIEALVFLRRYGWILAVAALAWWLHHQSATIADQHGQIVTLKTDLQAEKDARMRDVGGLTALASGLAKAAVDTRSDQKALSDAIKTPQPASPQLGDLLARLRAADASAVHPAPARTSAAATH